MQNQTCQLNPVKARQWRDLVEPSEEKIIAAQSRPVGRCRAADENIAPAACPLPARTARHRRHEDTPPQCQCPHCLLSRHQQRWEEERCLREGNLRRTPKSFFFCKFTVPKSFTPECWSDLGTRKGRRFVVWGTHTQGADCSRDTPL